jgi:flagellar hook-basal body complex protein FliE
MIGHAAQSAVQTMRQAEQVTASGIAGKADTQAVVQALSNAEVTMQTVVAVRDKILAAYNDVIHMNI